MYSCVTTKAHEFYSFWQFVRIKHVCTNAQFTKIIQYKYIYFHIIPSIPIPHYVAIKYALPWWDAGPIPISEYSPLNSDRVENSTIGKKARSGAVRKGFYKMYVMD